MFLPALQVLDEMECVGRRTNGINPSTTQKSIQLGKIMKWHTTADVKTKFSEAVGKFWKEFGLLVLSLANNNKHLYSSGYIRIFVCLGFVGEVAFSVSRSLIHMYTGLYRRALAMLTLFAKCLALFVYLILVLANIFHF